jgi:peptidoglycan hydrolase-like protein with peptidoglycan-binding domain
MYQEVFVKKISYALLSLVTLFVFVLASCSVPLMKEDMDANAATKATNSWPIVQKGENSAEARAVQYFLRYHGASLTADGVFGSGTESAVKSFQTAHSLTANGIVDSATWLKLIVTVKKGSNNEAVKALQYLLNAKYGKNLTVDGDFGAGTETAVKAFQTLKGLTSDGVVGQNTWLALIAKLLGFWDARGGLWQFPVN